VSRRHGPRVRIGAVGEVRLREDDEVPWLGAEAQEEGPQAVVGGEDPPGAADGAGARGVDGAEQAQDLGDHVGRDGVERAERQRRAVLLGGRLRAAAPRGTWGRRAGPRRRAREHGSPHLAEQHRHGHRIGAVSGGWMGFGSLAPPSPASRIVARAGGGSGRWRLHVRMPPMRRKPPEALERTAGKGS
jgi:hypothetical protein